MPSNRNSSIELLRIISMMTIIGVHYWGACRTFNAITPDESSYSLLKFLEILLSYGVNIFVIITGYFMVDRDSINIRKVVDLLWKLAFWGLILFSVSILVGINNFSASGLVKSLCPILFGYRWFIKAYIILYLFIPFINRLVHSITKRQLEVLIGLLLLQFSVWPFCLPNPPIDDYGFGFVNFFVIYIISAYLRLYVKYVPLSACLITFVLSTLVIWGLVSLDLASLSTMKAMALAHNSPIKLVACFSLFLAFTKWNWKSKVVNTLAASAFAVYIIHGDFNTMDYLFTHLLRGAEFQVGVLWILHMAISMVVIYLACFCLDFVSRPLYNIIHRLLNRISCINRAISA